MLLRLKSVSHVVARMIELDALFPLHGTSLDPTSTRMVLHNQLLLTALITKLTTRKPKNPIHQSRGRSGSSMADLEGGASLLLITLDLPPPTLRTTIHDPPSRRMRFLLLPPKTMHLILILVIHARAISQIDVGGYG